MHRALSIPEIAQMVCTSIGPLDDDMPDEEAHHALAALTRTCVAFHSPALDILWFKTTVTRILIGCMPEDLWTEVRETVNGRQQGEFDCFLLGGSSLTRLLQCGYSLHGLCFTPTERGLGYNARACGRYPQVPHKE
jgi:hypothetical protein